MTAPTHRAMGMSCQCDHWTIQEANSNLCATAPTCHPCDSEEEVCFGPRLLKQPPCM